MYCLPPTMYVMGDPLCGAGIQIAPTSLPVCLSYARSMAPRGCSGVVVTTASPITTSVFVTINPTPDVPACPVFGMFKPFSAGWLRMLSGVSPCGTCHISSPRSRLMAERRPYGGFTIGSPCTVNPPPPVAGGLAGAPAAAVGAAGAAGAVGRGGASAAQQSPGPRTSRNSCPPRPDTYLMSEKPGGGATSDRADGVLPACA